MQRLERWLAAIVLTAAPTATLAGLDVAFSASTPIGDDGRLFVSISSQYFDRDVRVVDNWGRRFSDPDDLAVFLHICSHTRTSPEIIFSYRKQGMTWFDIGMRLNVPVDTWFVPVKGDPGPPYGKAYGYWRKHKSDRSPFKLNDRQCRDLIAVRMASSYYRVPVQTAMDWRRHGTDVSDIMNREYRTRHGKGGGKGKGQKGGDDQARNQGPGNSHNKNKHKSK
jgi:hypothetical protein